MRLRAFIMLGAAFALATVSVVLARAWIVEQTGDQRATPQSVQVAVTRIVVAAEPLPYGGKILRPKLRLVDWPAASVPQGAFTSLDDVVGALGSVAEERLVLRSLARDEPVLKSKISGFGARASLSTMIAPGQRAATIRVNEINGVAGFVLPGDRVDVLLTRELGGGPGQHDLATDILLQSMKVLGIDQDANAEREKPAVVRAVTLEVTQDEAQKLTLAQKLGTLSLALRHASAADVKTPRTITARDLPLALPAKIMSETNLPAQDIPLPKVMVWRDPPPPLTAPLPVSSVRIVRGLDVSVYEVAIETPIPRAEPSSMAGLKSPPSASALTSMPPVPRRRFQPPVPGARLEAATRGRSISEPSIAPAGSATPTGLPQPPKGTDAGRAPRGPGENG